MNHVSNEAGFTVVRDGYDPVEVEERLAELQTKLAMAADRSAAVERVLRATIAEASALLARLDGESGVPAGREPRTARRRQAQQLNQVEISEPGITRDAVASTPEVAPAPESPVPDHTANDAGSPAAEVSAPATSPERQWIRGTVREISRTETGATIWLIPEDQPHSVVSIFFTNEEVGAEAVAYVYASFTAGEAVRVWHTDRQGHDIEPI